MAIYTCLDMIRDCRENKPEGWRYLVTRYVPVMRYLLARYYAGRSADTKLLERVLLQLRQANSTLFAAPGPGTEREFVAAMRQKFLEGVELDKASAGAEIPLELETMTTALEPLTATEKQMLWFQSMAYDAESTAKLMNLEPSTIQKVRERSDELLRGNMDQWKPGLAAANGLVLGLEAARAGTKDCLPAKAYLDTIDGRITWSRKQDYEYHVARCWHCVDHFARIREADYALRVTKPLTAEECVPWFELLGVPEEKKRPLWQKMFAR